MSHLFPTRNQGPYLPVWMEEVLGPAGELVMPLLGVQKNPYRPPRKFSENPEVAMIQIAALLPTSAEILSGNCCPPERLYRTAEVSMIGTAFMGTVTTIAALVSGVPVLAGITGLLSTASATGAVMAHQLAFNTEEFKRQTEAFKTQNTRLATNVKEFAGQNAVLGENILALGAENRTLRLEVENLHTNVASFSDQNMVLERNVGDLSTQLTQAALQTEDYRTQNAALQENVENFTSQLAQAALQNENHRFQNTALQESIKMLTDQLGLAALQTEDYRTQNAALQQSIENITDQVAQFALQNANYRTLGEQFRGYIDAFRSGHEQNRDEFLGRLDGFTQQVVASQTLWDRISQDTSIFRQNYTEQLTQLRGLITQLTDPRNTLTRLEEHQNINRQIQQAVATLNQNQQQLMQLNEQIALREGQLRERDQLLGELRNAHQEILTGYRDALSSGDNSLEGLINRIESLIGRLTGTSCEVAIDCDVGLGNTLGICSEPSWSTPSRFQFNGGRWKGEIPLGKAFKFVNILSNGSMRWEQSANRVIRSSGEALRVRF